MSALRGEGLSHSWGARRVLEDFAIEVEAGQVVGLIGPNGAGKSTSFKLLAGVEPVREGRVWLGDHEVGRLPLEARARLGLGYLAQETSVFRGLDARGNVVVGLEAAGVPRAERRRRADAILDDVGLAEAAATRAEKLSGGERRKLEIARLLAISPRVLLLDEPFTGLDPIAAAGLRALVRRLAARGAAVLLTDHHVATALPACDRAVLIVGGRIRLAGKAEEVAGDPLAREEYLGR